MRYLLFFLIFSTSCFAQHPIDTYLGPWAGQMEDANAFLFDLSIQKTGEESYQITFSGLENKTNINLPKTDNGYFSGRFGNELKVILEETESNPILFVQVGHHLSHIRLKKVSKITWKGSWNLLLSGASSGATLYLSLEQDEAGPYSASVFFREPTFHYTLGQEFRHQGKFFEFRDIRSNINFKGQLEDTYIDLSLRFLNEEAIIRLQPKPYEDWTIGQAPELPVINGYSVEDQFPKLLEDLKNGHLEGTHGILITHKNKPIFEHYFEGFDTDTPHDTRSLSKSFATAMVGIAIDQELLKDENQPIKRFFETDYPEVDWSAGKDRISIAHLLTMSSGLDAIDFGLDRESFANEGQYQSQKDWTKHILSAPMVYAPGSAAYYGSGNPHLIAPILAQLTEERLEFFIHKKLFQPIGISNYRLQTNNEDVPYFGGGWYISPRDLLKFGHLYLNGGKWGRDQIIPEDWIQQSMAKHQVLENTTDKNEYGFLFWHKTYEVQGQSVASIEARGSGGQYLFLIPSLDIVAVITSGNYRNGQAFQPERIMQEYVLPEVLKE